MIIDIVAKPNKGNEFESVPLLERLFPYFRYINPSKYDKKETSKTLKKKLNIDMLSVKFAKLTELLMLSNLIFCNIVNYHKISNLIAQTFMKILTNSFL